MIQIALLFGLAPRCAIHSFGTDLQFPMPVDCPAPPRLNRFSFPAQKPEVLVNPPRQCSRIRQQTDSRPVVLRRCPHSRAHTTSASHAVTAPVSILTHAHVHPNL